MPIQLVPDPTHTGKGPAPNIIKADAMRKLHAAGLSVSEIALRYAVSYHAAYKAINPPRKPVDSPASTARKVITPERATQLSKSQLLKIVQKRTSDAAELERIAVASNELDRRYPGWVDEL